MEHEALQALRLRNLLKLNLGAKELSDISMARRKVGRVTFWADVLRGTKRIGERLARLIEGDHDLTTGWMDEPDANVAAAAMPFKDLDAFESQLVTIYRQIGKAGGRPAQEHALNEINLLLSRVNAAHPDPTATAADPFAKTRGKLFTEANAAHLPAVTTPAQRGAVKKAASKKAS